MHFLYAYSNTNMPRSRFIARGFIGPCRCLVPTWAHIQIPLIQCVCDLETDRESNANTHADIVCVRTRTNTRTYTTTSPSTPPSKKVFAFQIMLNEDTLYYCSKRNNVIVVFGIVKVQPKSNLLTEVIE